MSALIGTQNMITDGLVLYSDIANINSYPTTGTIINDLSDSRNTLTLSNGPTFNATYSGNIVLDGTNDSLVYLGSGTTTLTTTFSLSTFIKLDRVTGTQMLINRCGGAGAFYSHNYYWAVLNGYLYLSFRDTSGNYPSATSNVLLSANTIYQLGVTYSSATGISYYINGVQRNTFSSNSLSTQVPFLNTLSVLAVGGNYAEGKDYTKGSVYTAQIYNRVLSSTEMSQNYNVLKNRFGL